LDAPSVAANGVEVGSQQRVNLPARSGQRGAVKGAQGAAADHRDFGIVETGHGDRINGQKKALQSPGVP
jgi:hypothetical protein